MRTQQITIQVPDDIQYRKGDHLLPNIANYVVIDAQEPVVTTERYRYNVTILIDQHSAGGSVRNPESLRSILSRALASDATFPGWRERNLVVEVDPPVKVD